MLKLLVVTQFIPMPDRWGARLFLMLQILAARYNVHFYPDHFYQQVTQFGTSALAPYETNLHDMGIVVHLGGPDALTRAIHQHKFDIVMFVHHHFATLYLDRIRYAQPQAKLVIDTVDIQYASMLSRARVKGRSADVKRAQQVKKSELAAYRASDVVIAISDQEKAVLAREDAAMSIEVIPLLLELGRSRPDRDGTSCKLLFVGNFMHAPNVDAIVYFCSKVLPLIKAKIAHATLQIVGNAPNDAVKKLAGDGVEVAGHVPDLAPYYANADISVAPLTWGGGLKGKVAEAMAHGLPVVSTSVGIEGFGLSPNENVVLGDTPEEFSRGVIRLHEDRDFYEKIRGNGRLFVENKFAGEGIRKVMDAVFDNIERCPVKKLSFKKRLKHAIPASAERNLLWRFKRLVDRTTITRAD